MKNREAILSEFIKDFNLEMEGERVCFNADIEFNTASIFKKFNCEVHIITMTEKQLSVIYLLQKELSALGIPDTFSFDSGNFFYVKKQPLVIRDYDLLRGKYVLIITPIKSIGKTMDIKPEENKKSIN